MTFLHFPTNSCSNGSSSQRKKCAWCWTDAYRAKIDDQFALVYAALPRKS